MRVVTVYFEPGNLGRYDAARMLAAYRRSVAAVGLELEIILLPTPGPDRNVRNPRWMVEVEAKLRAWLDVMATTTEPTILTDCDMLMLRNPADLFDRADWDIAVTVRPGYPPINTGVLAVRPTAGARLFAERWWKAHRMLREDPPLYHRWQHLFAASDQASMGWMLVNNQPDCIVRRLPCEWWNCADQEWATDQPDRVRLLHVKGRLRESLLGLPLKHPVEGNKQKAAISRWSAVWRSFDA